MQPIKDFIKLAAKKAGYSIRNTNTGNFGIDFWNDIRKLSFSLNRPVETIFDIGANSGDTTIAAKKEFPNSYIYAFEPHLITFTKLQLNTKNLASVKLLPLALSNQRNFCTFYDYGGSGHVNSLVQNTRFANRFDRHATEIKVNTSTIDIFCDEHSIKRVNVLKTDTEGNDYEVFLGAEKMLRAKTIDFIYFEFNDFCPKAGTHGGSLNEISAYLSNFDFHFIATYTDFVITDGEIFVVANALLSRGKD